MNTTTKSSPFSESNNFEVTYMRRLGPPQVRWRGYYIGDPLILWTGIAVAMTGCTWISSHPRNTSPLFKNSIKVNYEFIKENSN